MVLSSNLGFPRIGPKRELKKNLEAYWSGKISEEDFCRSTALLRETNWKLQKAKGIDIIPSNDFSLYDHVLDAAVMVGAIPRRYDAKENPVSLKNYFAMARGEQSVPAMEMTKWFDTNYHYIVPEFEKDQTFKLNGRKVIEEFIEAKNLGIHTRPVLLGPVSFLLLGKMKGSKVSQSKLLALLLPVYESVLSELKDVGADWVQLDEPCLIQSLTPESLVNFTETYNRLSRISPRLKIMLTTYFGGLRENLSFALKLHVGGLHLDLVRDPLQLDFAAAQAPANLILSLGLVNGRNVWRTSFNDAIDLSRKAVAALGKERVIIAPSCSLMFSPVDLGNESRLDEEMKSWMAFAVQKLEEVSVIKRSLNESIVSVYDDLKKNQHDLTGKKTSEKIHDPQVKKRIAELKESDGKRKSPFSSRKKQQAVTLKLPLFPTTTIGSFAQTEEVRAARAAHRTGKINDGAYFDFLESEVVKAVHFQEEAGLDVFVHGEFERNDMVEYFGERLKGFISTENGWVQSYGSRCVKPPVIIGDVSRPEPMTVGWWKYTQNLTKKPVKGMLTGPVTILQWSFVRDDQERSITCRQIALAIRDEVDDLEKAGAKIIQIDEPAMREGLPLRREDWESYLNWSVNSFKIASSSVKDATQIHTHMCYSEFNDILQAVEDLDADVISIETSRSQMELLGSFGKFKYPNQIGPGVYDIHSPRIPTEEEMTELLVKALTVLSPNQIWVNPDCGLKTRRWEEIKPALVRMVAAAAKMRNDFSPERGAP